MRVVGLIAEYNPFHNGHQYHIEKAKKIANADFAVVVMSGNFVQRGTPAIMPKYMRTEAALNSGADLVIELPVCYATGTAEQFAFGAISLLEKTGCVDAICFGSECGNIDSLSTVAEILCNESVAYKNALQTNLRSGMSFPLARQTALDDLYPKCNYGQLLSEPNNILGIEYIKALKRINTTMEPITIKREVSHYHDTELQEEFSSASAIRNIISTGNFDHLNNQIPCECMPSLKDCYEVRYPVYANDFSLLLKYKLMNENSTSLNDYADVSEELANRIMNRVNEYVSFEQFCELLKTKEITYSRISRALLHILLGIRKGDNTEIEYARILGFRKDSSNLLTTIKNLNNIKLITKLSLDYNLSDDAKRMLDTDIYAANLYESVLTEKFKTPFTNEFQHAIKIIL